MKNSFEEPDYRLPIRNAEVTRRALLNAAQGLYEKHGYDATNLRLISEQVGLTTAAIYYHFRSKDEMLVAAYVTSIQRMIEAHDQIQKDLEPTDNLWTFAVTHVHLQMPPSYSGPRRFGASQLLVSVRDDAEPLRNVMRRYRNVLIEILSRGMKQKKFPKANKEALAFAIFGMNQHIAHWYNLDGTISPNELAEYYAKLALQMVGAPQPKNLRRLRALVGDALKLNH